MAQMQARSPEVVPALRAWLEEGAPDLRIEPVAVPALCAGEVLIDVRAVAIGKWELGWSEGWSDGVLTPGREFSGVVRSVGPECSQFGVGDEVAGWLHLDRPGAAVTRTVVSAAHLVKRPAGVSSIAAAALPLAALTVAQGLYETAQLAQGARVLVVDGGGDATWFAVQIAGVLGADVALVTKGHHRVELAARLGVTEILRRGAEGVPDTARFDVVVVCEGSAARVEKIGEAAGHLQIKEDEPSVLLRSEATTRAQLRHLEELMYLVENKFLMVPIAATFPFSRSLEAFEYVTRTKRKPGKVVLIMPPPVG